MTPTTHVYRSIGGIDLLADVHAPASAPTALFVWFHGGALIMGRREDVPADLLDLVVGSGALLVSVGYRLAPQVGVTEIVEDARAAWAWALDEARRRGGDSACAHAVVGGLSAGGYLALNVGLSEPRPSAVVSYYGYGTIDGPWYSTPSAHYRSTWRIIGEEEAFAAVAGPTTTDGSRRPHGFDFYLYCRQTGRWPELAAGTTDAEVLRRHSPTFHVTDRYPPTLLLHGTDDHDVPHAESAAFAAALRANDVTHELISLEGFDHGLVPGDDPERIRVSVDATERAKRFIRSHLDPRR